MSIGNDVVVKGMYMYSYIRRISTFQILRSAHTKVNSLRQ